MKGISPSSYTGTKQVKLTKSSGNLVVEDKTIITSGCLRPGVKNMAEIFLYNYCTYAAGHFLAPPSKSHYAAFAFRFSRHFLHRAAEVGMPLSLRKREIV